MPRPVISLAKNNRRIILFANAAGNGNPTVSDRTWVVRTFSRDRQRSGCPASRCPSHFFFAAHTLLSPNLAPFAPFG